MRAIKRYEEKGWLNDDRGQLVLRRDGGGTWQLEVGFMLGWKAKRLVGKRVRVRGVRDGFNILAASSIEVERP